DRVPVGAHLPPAMPMVPKQSAKVFDRADGAGIEQFIVRQREHQPFENVAGGLELPIQSSPVGPPPEPIAAEASVAILQRPGVPVIVADVFGSPSPPVDDRFARLMPLVD